MSTARARLRDFLPNARELALLFAARGLAGMAAWHAGFRALSDDDYARIAIAQRFAAAPRFDPTGTSWLPAPFWIYGALFRCFGTGLGVARVTAIAAGLAATVLVYVAARMLGAARFGSLLGAAFGAALVPYSVLLGIAALPEVPCAALLLFGLATLSRRDPGIRACGGVALTLSCLSRYEAWPVALSFGLYCAWDAFGARRPSLLGCAALALAGPVIWLLVGHIEHGDALFFIGRVTAYRQALGGERASLVHRLIEYPRLLLWDGLLLWPLLAILWVRRPRAITDPFGYARSLVGLAALLGFMVLGSVRDGVPTHHAARVLLPIWFFAALVVGHLMSQAALTHVSRTRVGLVAVILVTLPFNGHLIVPAEGFAQRAAELDAGANARRYTHGALAIDTPDYGFFAVQAAFGSPSDTIVLDDHDPRHPNGSPFRDAATAEQSLRASSAKFALVSNAHLALLEPHCCKRWQNSSYTLLDCTQSLTGRD